MKILFTHSYRVSMVTRRDGHQVQVLACEDSLTEDLVCADEVILTDYRHRIQTLRKILADETCRPDAIVLAAPHDEECLLESRLAGEMRRLGVRVIGPSPDVCERCLDKRQTKRFLAQIGVPVVPELQPGEVTADDFPFVQKAPTLWSGQGVRLIRSAKEWAAARLGGEYFLERFRDGVEMSVQAVRYADRVLVSPPVYKGRTSTRMIHPLKKLRVFPNPWQPAINEALMDSARQIATALDAEGVLDIEYVVGDRGDWAVLEVNSRLSGLSRMIAAGGQNALDMLVAMAEGTWSDHHESAVGAAAEIPFTADLSPEQKERLLAGDGVEYLYERWDDAEETPRRRLLLKGDDLQQLDQRLGECRELLRVEPELLTEWERLLAGR